MFPSIDKCIKMIMNNILLSVYLLRVWEFFSFINVYVAVLR